METDIVRIAEQAVVIEAARAYLDQMEKRPLIDLEKGVPVGYLMGAEILIMTIVNAFTEPAEA